MSAVPFVVLFCSMFVSVIEADCCVRTQVVYA